MSRKWFASRVLWTIAAAATALLLVAGLAMRNESPQVTHVPLSDFLRDLDAGLVTDVVVSGDTLDLKLSDGRLLRTNAPINFIALNPAFIENLARRGVRLDVRAASDETAYGYGAFLLGTAFIGVVGVALYRVTSGRIPALEAKTREADPQTADVTFADVAGVDAAKEEV